MNTAAATVAPLNILAALTRREFARRVYFMPHPLCALCAIAHGEWIDEGVFYREGQFSLAQFIAYVEALPLETYLRLTTGGPFAQT